MADLMENLPGLDGLNDIVLPPAPPVWPVATEVWLVLVTCIYIIAVAVLHRRHLRTVNAYRQAGLKMLDNASTVYDISVILKRVALAVFPREQVASLYGLDWQRFLHKTCKQRDFEILIKAPSDSIATREQKELARYWIKHHRKINNDLLMEGKR
jgi:hypothetical protein